jgi:hypothetical protein
MTADELLGIISECDVLREDIEDVRTRLELSKSEGQRLAQAAASVEKAKTILSTLFPAIKSLTAEVREDLEAELCDS